MFLKNYTSNVPASVSIHRIEEVLIECGVTGIMKEYLGAKIISIQFRVLDSTGRPQMIRLPAKEDDAVEALWRDYMGSDLLPDGKIKWSSRKTKKRADFQKQGERTAWRIIKDWVEVQMSMIQLKQADVMEVFLPYAWDGKQTYYTALKSSGFAGLLTAPTESVIEGDVVVVE